MLFTLILMIPLKFQIWKMSFQFLHFSLNIEYYSPCACRPIWKLFSIFTKFLNTFFKLIVCSVKMLILGWVAIKLFQQKRKKESTLTNMNKIRATKNDWLYDIFGYFYVYMVVVMSSCCTCYILNAICENTLKRY